MSIFDELAQAVIEGNPQKVSHLADAALGQSSAPQDVLSKGLQAGTAEIGRRFREGECYVPEVLLAARAMHAGLDVLRPKLAETGMLGTVAGDLHDIGKNLVAMMLEGAGFNVVHLGIDVPIDKFIAAVKEHSPQIVGMSALITTTMPAMKQSSVR